ncbi:P-loop containing nucleoside triphosphate hydrolase [Sesbania bispinosa]|nr:P-loop containing nucleoside triphosphate hydrolase [Sesbania bispinosa]
MWVKVLYLYGQEIVQERLHKSLVDLGYEVSSIQGALDNEMKRQDCQGVQRWFDSGNLVINYDLPVKYTAGYNPDPEPDYEVYLHRVGRAGRFGRKEVNLNQIFGGCINLICDEGDEKLLSKIVNHFGTHVSEVREKSIEDYKGCS